MKKLVFIFSLFCSVNAISQVWEPILPLLYRPSEPGECSALLVWNGKLLIAGAFTRMGNTAINPPITWDGNTYNSITGFQNVNGYIVSFELYSNDLYFTGYFTSANNVPNTKYVARFNGTNFEALSSATPINYVNTLINKDNLYLGGDFSKIGSTIYRSIASYDGTSYSIMDGGLYDMLPSVRSFAIYNNDLIVGGIFDNAGTVNVNNIAIWNGTSWTAMKNGILGIINDMKIDSINNFLYVAGQQSTLGDGTPVSTVVRWNGYYWEDVFLPLNNTSPRSLYFYHKQLYAALYAPSPQDMDSLLMYYDGMNWINIPGLSGGEASVMCEYNDDLYIGGGFTMAGSDSVNGIVHFHMNPPTDCNWLMPRVFTNADTFYLGTGQADVQFYNNNAYAQSWQWDFGDTGTGNIKDPLHTYTQSGTYTATVTVTMDGCTKTAQKTITVLNGNEVQEYTKEKLDFKLYPNPTSGDITVEVTLSGSKSAELRAFSNSGTLQDKYDLTKGYNKVTIPASQWPNGVSLVGLFINGKQVFVEKVVKE